MIACCGVRLLAALLCLLLLAARPVFAAQALTIFVDGIDLYRAMASTAVGLPPQWQLSFHETRQSNYLAQSVLARELQSRLGGDQKVVVWNGDPTDTAAINLAVAQLETLLFVESRSGKDVHLVTHSMGSLIGYLALVRAADLAAKNPGARYPGIASFLTLGSPLGRSTWLEYVASMNPALPIPSSEKLLRNRSDLKIAFKWLNAYAEGDIFGATIGMTDVDNLEIVSKRSVSAAILNYSAGEAHSLPYKDASAVKEIMARLGLPNVAGGKQGGVAVTRGTYSGAEVAALVRTESDWKRVEALRGFAGKIAHNLSGEDAGKILEGLTGSARASAAGLLMNYLRDGLSGREVAIILGQEQENNRLNVLHAIAPKADKQLEVEDLTLILSGMTGESRGRALNLLR
jgi:hypothetical protein